MRRRVGFLFWAESFFAVLAAVLLVLTAIWPDWVEGISGYDPDKGNGSFEWELAVACAVVAVVSSLLARRQWRRAPLASAE